MEDRKSNYPGRVKLTPVEGTSDLFDMERADIPISQGTPPGKGNAFGRQHRGANFSSVFKDPVNLPWGTEVEGREADGKQYLFHGDRLPCAANSQITKDFFVQNDDGRETERGKLVMAIEKQLTQKNEWDKSPETRWAKIWEDS